MQYDNNNKNVKNVQKNNLRLRDGVIVSLSDNLRHTWEIFPCVPFFDWAE